MSSQLAVRLGVVEPQIVHLPDDVVSLAAAEEAIELADAYGVCGGFPLDESQKFTLRAGLGERGDGSWAAATVADFEPRQNGKNDTIAARELAGLILFGERLIIHTAHEFSTANESFLRLVAVFESWDELRKRVARIRYANGEQGIELLSGQRLKYRARTGGAGRGFAKADLTVYDEAQHVQAEHVAASGPARLANPNAQAWYAGSGGLPTSKNAWRLRKRALAGSGGRFAYVEHTAEKVCLIDGKVASEAPGVLEREAWALANPAYGRRITDESLLTLYDEMGPELFARECLCLWDAELGEEARVIPILAWQAVCSDGYAPAGRMVVAVDVNPERSWGSVAVADSAGVVELVDHRPGTGWLVGRAYEIAGRWNAQIALDPSGPAGSFLPELGEVVEVKAGEFAKACGAFYDDVIGGTARVHTHPSLDAAVAGAQKRASGDAWAWARKNETVDVSPLVAVTVARWAAMHLPEPVVGSVVNLADHLPDAWDEE